MRELSELIEVEDPAWPVLVEEFSTAAVPVEVLPVAAEPAHASLLQLQVTAQSWLGAVVLHSGGVLVDDGWIRVFGSPHPDDPRGHPGLAQVNGFPWSFEPEWTPITGLVVAHDVLGGVFAVNGPGPAGAGRPGEPGEVVYFAPDSLRWEALGAGYPAWLSWLLRGGSAEFYAGLRWSGWRELTRTLHGTEGISVVPFLWSAEARQELVAASHRPVPMRELLALGRDSGRRLDGRDPGFLGEL
ncbi:DUF2625 family protein [Streptomyces sp. NPDC006326]|uniref:DUF2625 family protein n=1 Tax=Streptomyces sp. NPDC006326 TaxID=3156752 RepID=UPI0033B02A2A